MIKSYRINKIHVPSWRTENRINSDHSACNALARGHIQKRNFLENDIVTHRFLCSFSLTMLLDLYQISEKTGFCQHLQSTFNCTYGLDLLADLRQPQFQIRTLWIMVPNKALICSAFCCNLNPSRVFSVLGSCCLSKYQKMAKHPLRILGSRIPKVFYILAMFRNLN